ncbi:MAG: hypothetical protein V2I54_13850 [Bacteroidales bacterium]|jgi:hypothetical protein|nr:hypothetical protein [Bacteroidales bacterium]
MKRIYVFYILILFLSLNQAKAQEENEDKLTVGGAIRFNMISEFYESDPTALNTKATWDTWRINVDGSYAGIDMSFEYRWYPTFGTHFIHHGWFGYGFNDDVYMKLGVSQVPFGITSFASHSWWFQGPYYVGLEDDYDMGIKFDLSFIDNLDLAVAYYRQAEPEGPYLDFGLGRYNVTFGNAGAGRYSYDLTPSDSIPVRELNQFNLRAAYHINEDVEIGASAQFGQNYNSVTDNSELSTAFAAHIVANYGNFNFKGEFVNYNYNATDLNGNDVETVPMGAYGSVYGVAKKANMYVAGLAYSIDVDWGPISNIQPYIDFTLMDKANENFVNTYHLIPGFLVTSGKIYTYVDFALGKNQPWLSENFGTGIGQGRTYSDEVNPDLYYYSDDPQKIGTPVPIEDVKWNLRFNINMGYYF